MQRIVRKMRRKRKLMNLAKKGAKRIKKKKA